MKQSFWDTLIDRLEQDIQSEMARTHRFKNTQTQGDAANSAYFSATEPNSDSVSWDLIGQLNFKLGGPRQFKARAQSGPRSNPHRPVQKLGIETPHQETVQPLAHLNLNSNSSASEPLTWPEVSDIEVLATLEQLRRYGLSFVASDLDQGSPAGVTRSALNRERKRLLAKNHPDRAHSSAQVKQGLDQTQTLTELHARFTAIADLFESLMLRATSAR